MKTFKVTIPILVITLLLSCSKDDSGNNAAAENTLSFKGNPITFNSLSIDDEAPNNTSEYIFTTTSGLSMVFYCKYIGTGIQNGSIGTVTYTTYEVDYQPVNNYPQLTVRGYINY